MATWNVQGRVGDWTAREVAVATELAGCRSRRGRAPGVVGRARRRHPGRRARRPAGPARRDRRRALGLRPLPGCAVLGRERADLPVAPRARGRPAAARRAREPTWRHVLVARVQRPDEAEGGPFLAVGHPPRARARPAPHPSGPDQRPRPRGWRPASATTNDRRAANPAVLGGDLNVVPWSDEVRGLTGSAGPHVPGLVFVDAWDAAGNEGRGDTWASANPRVPRRAVHPNRRLDYVMVSWPRRRVSATWRRAAWPARLPSTGSGPATTTPWWPTSTSEPSGNPGPDGAPPCDHHRMADRYTHGHHESVLRSHRWRTAENSAAYLLPHLRPGPALLDVGCGPGTITARPRGRVAPGSGRRRRRPRTRSSWPTEAATTRARRTSTFAVATCTPSTSRRRPSTSSTPTRCSSTSPTRSGRCARCGGSAPGRARRGPRQRLRRVHLVPRRCPRSTAGWRCTSGRPGQRRRARRRPAPARLGPAAGLHRRRRPARPGASPTPEDRAWWGGLWADRVVASAFADQAVEYGLSDRAELDEIAAAFRRWALSDDAVFVVLHVEVLARV